MGRKQFGHVAFSILPIIVAMLALLVPLHSAIPQNTEGRQTHAVPGQEVRAPSKRGKEIGGKIDAKALFHAYKEIQTEYYSKAFDKGSASKWRRLAKKGDIEVDLMEHPSDPSCPYVRMVGVYPVSAESCWDWLTLKNWPKNMPKMDPFYEGVDVHGNFDHRGVNMKLARKRTKRIFAFGKRDLVFLSVSDKPLSDGTLVSGTVSVDTPTLPRQKGYTRAFQDSIAFYKPLEGNTKTEVTIICRIDMNDSSSDGSGGWFPMWLYVKTIGSTGAQSVANMRKALLDDIPSEIPETSVEGRSFKKRLQQLLTRFPGIQR